MTAPESLSREEEARLIQKAKDETEAFGVLYEHHVGRIYNYIYYRTGNHQDAEDLTARVFYRALAKIDDYEERGAPFAAWLYRIAHNLVANWHRNRSRHNVMPLDEFVVPDDEDAVPEALAETHEEHAHLLATIRRLPPDRQQVLILKFVEHLSNAEIGQIMGRTEGAIKALYHRTLTSLRKDFQLQDGAPKSAGGG